MNPAVTKPKIPSQKPVKPKKSTRLQTSEKLISPLQPQNRQHSKNFFSRQMKQKEATKTILFKPKPIEPEKDLKIQKKNPSASKYRRAHAKHFFARRKTQYEANEPI